MAATLPVIVGKSLDKGWRVLLASSDAERLAVLDEMLWRDGFIPHGISGGVADADQPVLLTVDGVSVNANKADILVLVDGVALDIALVSNFQRVCLLFNGDDAGRNGAGTGRLENSGGRGYDRAVLCPRGAGVGR